MAGKKKLVTRGGLTPGKLVNLKTKEEINFMFNPVEYTMSKKNTWDPEKINDVDMPYYRFSKGGPITLSLTLHFDTLMEEASRKKPYDVRYHTDPLWDLVLVTDPGTQKASPPLVEFQWGKLVFKCFITSMTQTFTLFDPDGIPVRAKVALEMTKFHNQGKPMVTSISGPKPVSKLLTTADRADLVASFMLGLGAGAAGTAMAAAPEVADATREVMETNNVDNPLNMAAGTNVTNSGGSS